ncbi:MAG TPA: glutamate cyclase domain-containing protein [Verrucomicrobiae bacterium]|nr:glutamate cyclase domain-containing protein [Verrucomicrobiae bacterium]
MSLQALLVRNDTRGIARRCAGVLPSDNVEAVAKALHKLRGQTVAIATGFFVNNRLETDGPPGAIALGHCLSRLGCQVVMVSRKDALEIMQPHCRFEAAYAEIRVRSQRAAKNDAAALLRKFNPASLVAVEVCGSNRHGRYCDMKGNDISAVTPPMDILFELARGQNRFTIGIGDGGNEIGFGNISPSLIREAGVEPCRTKTSALIVASISNWGAYGLIYSLSRIAGEAFLPSLAGERRLIRGLLRQDAVDGFSGRPIARVDGRSLGRHEELLQTLLRRLRRAVRVRRTD